MRLAYFVDTFPVLSETFVLNEIDVVASKGNPINIISLNRPTSENTHPIFSKWIEHTKYLEPNNIDLIGSARAIIYLFIKNSLKFLSALFWQINKDKHLRWRFRKSFYLAATLKKLNIEHIHAHFASDAAELAWIIHKLTGIKFSVSTHGYDIYVAPYRYLKALSRDAMFIRSVCLYNNIALLKLGVSSSKIQVIHCGVRTEQFFSDTNNEKTIDILCVARLHPVKGIEYLIDAVILLVETYPSIRVCIAGDGIERERLISRTHEYNLGNNIYFVGPCNQQKIRYLLAASKVFCLPSLGDSVGVASMEAMAMRVPVVSTRIKGIPELVQDGINGFLVPAANSVALAQKLAILLEDDNLRYSFGIEAQKFVMENFNQETEAQKLIFNFNKESKEKNIYRFP